MWMHARDALLVAALSAPAAFLLWRLWRWLKSGRTETTAHGQQNGDKLGWFDAIGKVVSAAPFLWFASVVAFFALWAGVSLGLAWFEVQDQKEKRAHRQKERAAQEELLEALQASGQLNPPGTTTAPVTPPPNTLDKRIKEMDAWLAREGGWSIGNKYGWREYLPTDVYKYMPLPEGFTAPIGNADFREDQKLIINAYQDDKGYRQMVSFGKQVAVTLVIKVFPGPKMLRSQYIRLPETPNSPIDGVASPEGGLIRLRSSHASPSANQPPAYFTVRWVEVENPTFSRVALYGELRSSYSGVVMKPAVVPMGYVPLVLPSSPGEELDFVLRVRLSRLGNVSRLNRNTFELTTTLDPFPTKMDLDRLPVEVHLKERGKKDPFMKVRVPAGKNNEGPLLTLNGKEVRERMSQLGLSFTELLVEITSEQHVRVDGALKVVPSA